MNSNITVGDKPFLWEECVKNGIIFVNDLLDLSGDLMKILDFFFAFLSIGYNLKKLISAIPKTWKIKLQNG